jgi:hypothetical protein
MSASAEDLPRTIVFVVSDTKNWMPVKNMPATDGSNVLWIGEGPVIWWEPVIVSGHKVPVSVRCDA